MKSFVLLVTWIVSGQPPSSYQTTFTSAEACEAARNAVLADGQRIKTDYNQRIINGAKSIGQQPDVMLMMNHPAPAVTAVCAAQ